MPPTMRGGDRAWQERMPAEVEIDHECSVRMARGSTGRRGLTKRGAKKELQSGDATEAPSSAQGERPGVVAKSKAKGVREADGPLRDSQARSSRVRVADSKDEDAGAVAGRKTRQPRRGSDEAKSGSTRETTKVFGPMRPPAAKQKRKKGAAIAALEGRDLFRNGDWSAIERFATVKLPMYSVAWATLKGYESCWKHWVSFQYYAQLGIFVEVSSPATRRRTATWMLSFVALLAYAAGYKASTIKKCLMAISFVGQGLTDPLPRAG